MRVLVGSDHAGFSHKGRVLDLLKRLGHEVEDAGVYEEKAADYPDVAVKVALRVASGKAERGILICGTGIGMSITANKVKGIRAALCTDERLARLSRKHNDANVLCLGGRTTPWETAARIVEVWMNTPFEGGRHRRRVLKISEYECSEASVPSGGEEEEV